MARILEGERRLMLAVLEDAVSCFQKYAGATRPRNKRLFQEAEEWFMDEEASWVFSFEAICTVLGYRSASIFAGSCSSGKQGLLAQPPQQPRQGGPGPVAGGSPAQDPAVRAAPAAKAGVHAQAPSQLPPHESRVSQTPRLLCFDAAVDAYSEWNSSPEELRRPGHQRHRTVDTAKKIQCRRYQPMLPIAIQTGRAARRPSP